MSTATDAPRPAPTLALLLILGSLAAFGSLSIDMYLPSFGAIARDLRTTLPHVQLSLTTFFVGLAVGQILYGPLTDRYGRKRPLYCGLALYTLASFACAAAPGIGWLVTARFFQALGACAGFVILRAIVRDLFDQQNAARTFSLLMLITGVMPILGPLFGGYVAQGFGWRAIFWGLGGLSALCLFNVARRLPETHRPDQAVEVEHPGTIFARVLRDRNFLGCTLAGGIAQAGMFAYITGSPFVFIQLFGVAPERFGLVFGANAFGLIACSQLNGRLLRTISSARVLRHALTALAVLAVALIALALLRPSFWTMAIPLFLILSALGMTFPNATAGALANQGRHVGSASALMGTMQFTLSALTSGAVTRFHNGTPLPMALVVGGCGLTAFVLHRALVTDPI